MVLISWRFGRELPACVGPLATLLAPFVAARLGLFVIARHRCDGCGGRAGALFQPAGVILEIAVEVAYRAIGHQPELVADAAQQATIVRHHDDRAGELLQRGDQRVAHFEVEMVGRFVEQQQVGPLRHENREREAGALTAGKMHHGLEHAVAAETETSEMVAAALLIPLASARRSRRCAVGQGHQRRVARVEPVDFELGEVADDQIGRSDAFTGGRRAARRR